MKIKNGLEFGFMFAMGVGTYIVLIVVLAGIAYMWKNL